MRPSILVVVFIFIPFFQSIGHSTFLKTFDTSDSLSNEGNLIIKSEDKIHIAHQSKFVNAERTGSIGIIEDCTSPKLYSEYNKTIVDPTKEWYVVEDDGWGIKNNRMRFSTDSIKLGNYFYHALLMSDDSTGNTYKVTGKYGRETGSKFWVLDSLLDTEYLMTDMSLTVGDKFRMREGAFNDNPEFRVLSRDSIFLDDGSKRLRLGLSCSSNNFPEKYWVEGIGHISGPFQTSMICYADTPVYAVTCYFENGEQIYKSDEYSCWERSSVEEVSLQKLIIYPNPGSDKLNVIIDQKVQLPLMYELLNVSGQVLEIGQLSTKSNFSIDVRHLSSGLYFITLVDKQGKLWSGKWIKE